MLTTDVVMGGLPSMTCDETRVKSSCFHSPGFVDFRQLPAGLPRHQQLNLFPSIYATVESTELSPSIQGDVNCDMFVHLHAEVGANTDGFVSQLKFYLADVEAFVDPCIVILNLGGQTDSHFWVQNRRKWAKSFANWLHAAHHMDHMDRLNDNDDTDSDKEQGTIAGFRAQVRMLTPLVWHFLP